MNQSAMNQDAVFADLGRALLLGHRGAPRAAHENTAEAFRHALEAGLDGIELDVQPTEDGVLAVHHDATLRDRPLASMSWAGARHRAPWLLRIEEVFELMDDYPDRYLNVELKSVFPKADGREAALSAALAAWNGPVRQRTWISCFDPAALLRLARPDAPAPLALLISDEHLFALLPCLPVSAVHVKHSLLDPERLQRLKLAGKTVCAWTVNDPARAAELLSWGVDGLIGDEPQVLLTARDVTP